jgi:hypothetical protein
VPSDGSTRCSRCSILEADVGAPAARGERPESDVAFAGGRRRGRQAVRSRRVTARANGRVRLSLDATTHRVIAVELQPTPQGAWRDRRRWSEYVQVEGVWWPRREARELDGETVSNTMLRKLVVNGPVDTMLFRRPLVMNGEIRGME